MAAPVLLVSTRTGTSAAASPNRSQQSHTQAHAFAHFSSSTTHTMYHNTRHKPPPAAKGVARVLDAHAAAVGAGEHGALQRVVHRGRAHHVLKLYKARHLRGCDIGWRKEEGTQQVGAGGREVGWALVCESAGVAMHDAMPQTQSWMQAVNLQGCRDAQPERSWKQAKERASPAENHQLQSLQAPRLASKSARLLLTSEASAMRP